MYQPIPHVVMSFVSADDASAAVLLLRELGVADVDVASYTPAQMRARAAVVLGRFSLPTQPGLEPDLVTTQRELARRGHSFVIVRANSALLLQRIGRVAIEAHAYSMRNTPAAPRLSARPMAHARNADRDSPLPIAPPKAIQSGGKRPVVTVPRMPGAE